MPSRKQRQRKLKSKRHEWETVWVDDDGNELDAPPEDALEREREKKERTTAKATATSKNGGKPAGRGMRREPQPPSWNRAVKRAGLLGIVVFFLFTMAASGSSNRYVAALVPAAIYTALFVPFTYMIDRFAYRRYQAKQSGGGAAATPRAAKKR